MIENSTDHNLQDMEAEKQLKSLDSAGQWMKLYRFRGSRWFKTCHLHNSENIFTRFPISMFHLQIAVVFFFILAVLLTSEIAYAYYMKKEQNRVSSFLKCFLFQFGAWAMGTLHLILIFGVILSLVFFRLDWDNLWSESIFGEGPRYPEAWFDVEIFAWLMAVCYMFEMIFHRVVRGRIYISSHIKSYNIAQKESEMGYISAFEEPFDGSYEM